MTLLSAATWVAAASAKGTVLIGAVTLLRGLLAPATASPARHALWLPAFACLICPLGPHLPLPAALASHPAAMAALRGALTRGAVPTRTPVAAFSTSARAAAPREPHPPSSGSASPEFPGGVHDTALGDVLQSLALLWAIGAAALASLYLVNFLKFRRIRFAGRTVEEGTHRVLERCREELGLRRPVRLLESRAIESPTVLGWWRPTLLLPTGLPERLGAARLRHVLLHELAHVKRNDVLVNWIAALAQLLHWFNPGVWLAARLMRSDMESACDARVLDHLSQGERGEYGQMLVQLADSHGGGMLRPYQLGIADRYSDLKGRLLMISRFGPASNRIKLATGLTLAALALIALIQPGFPAPSGASSDAARGAQAAATGGAVSVSATESARTGGVPMRLIIEQVAANIHKRVVVDPSVASTVILYGQRLDQIGYADFLTILRINGFTAIEVNNYINVVPIADVRTLPLPTFEQGVELPDDQFANMSVELKNTCAYGLIPLLRPRLPRYAYLAADGRSNTVLAVDTYANLIRVRSIILEIDARTKPGHQCNVDGK